MARGPLSGLTVVVAASEDNAEKLAHALRDQGASVIPFPTVRLGPPQDLGSLDNAIRRWTSFDWVVFTSAHGVDAVSERARALGIDLRHTRGRIAAVGPATGAALQRYGLAVDAMPREFLTDEIVALLGDVRGKRILLPRSRLARKSLAEDLTARGAQVLEVDAYDAVRAPSPPGGLRASEIDFVVFTSASSAQNLASSVPEEDLLRLREHAAAAAIGPVTADAARALGFRVTVVAEEHTIPGLVRRLAEVGTHG